MKLFGKGNGLDDMFKSKGKMNPLAIVLIVVIVLAGGYFVYSNFFAGGSSSDTAATDATMNSPQPGANPANPPTQPGANPSGPNATPGANPPASPEPAAPPANAPKPTVKPAGNAAEMRTMTVFQNVTVSYPKGWGLALGASNSYAVFTNGKAKFEVHPPDPKANSAQAMAVSALAALGKKAVVTAEGPEKVANQDAYVYELKVGGQPMRLVAVDAPTRVILREYVKGGQIGSYKSTFSMMESKLAFK